MKKLVLYKKLQNISPKAVKELGITKNELDYIKAKLLNDKLGLKLNFTEIDEQLWTNYIMLEEVPKLSINTPPPATVVAIF